MKRDINKSPSSSSSTQSSSSARPPQPNTPPKSPLLKEQNTIVLDNLLLHKLKTCNVILSVNARSMNNKMDEITEACELYQPSALLIQETWQEQPHINYKIPNYNGPYRLERAGKKGGGLAIYLHNKTELIASKNIDTTAAEIQQINFISKGKSYNLVNVYKPPDKDAITLAAELEEKLEKKNRTIVMGDFNINWAKDSAEKRALNNIMQTKELSQKIDMPTRVTETSATVIDLAFTNIHHADFYICDLNMADHDAILMAENVGTFKETKAETEYNLKLDENTIESIKNHLQSIDWTYLNTLEAEKGFNSVHDALRTAVQMHLKKPKLRRNKTQPWQTEEIVEMTKGKNQLYKKPKAKKTTIYSLK